MSAADLLFFKLVVLKVTQKYKQPRRNVDGLIHGAVHGADMAGGFTL